MMKTTTDCALIDRRVTWTDFGVAGGTVLQGTVVATAFEPPDHGRRPQMIAVIATEEGYLHTPAVRQLRLIDVTPYPDIVDRLEPVVRLGVYWARQHAAAVASNVNVGEIGRRDAHVEAIAEALHTMGYAAPDGRTVEDIAAHLRQRADDERGGYPDLRPAIVEP